MTTSRVVFLFLKLILLRIQTHNKNMYFNYHAKIKGLIGQGHCVGFKRLERYHKISPCILIYFDNEKPMPIREYRFEEYLFLFAKFGIKEIKIL